MDYFDRTFLEFFVYVWKSDFLSSRTNILRNWTTYLRVILSWIQNNNRKTRRKKSVSKAAHTMILEITLDRCCRELSSQACWMIYPLTACGRDYRVAKHMSTFSQAFTLTKCNCLFKTVSFPYVIVSQTSGFLGGVYMTPGWVHSVSLSWL